MKKHLQTIWKFLKKDLNLTIVIIFSLSFAICLMSSTFSYDDKGMLISSKLWSDFTSHIAIIRSFSVGNNFPPEYPLYTGEPMRYHFMFYLLVGLLEKIGLRIDFALNSLSIIGFGGLMIAIFLLARRITKSNLASWFSVVFFLFNSSLSWYYFNWNSAASIQTNLNTAITAQNFYSFGPYDGKLVSAFWNLNIYTNQRHLAFAFLAMIISVYLIYYRKGIKSLILGIIILGLMSWLHKAILMITIVVLGCHFILFNDKSKRVFIATFLGGLLSLPGLAYLNTESAEGSIKYAPGFLYESVNWKDTSTSITDDFQKWLYYWLFNMGLLPFLAIPGVILLFEKFKDAKNKYESIYRSIFNEKYVWLISAIAIFAIANTFTFSIDVATNHKLINFSIFILNIYAAYFIAFLIKNKNILFKALSVIFFIGMTLGGILDIFPIFNDTKYTWADIPQDTTAKWIVDNTKPEDRFFNVTYEKESVFAAGRRIFWGWPYFTWSIGYNLEQRQADITEIIQGNWDKPTACKYFNKNQLKYIILDQGSEKFLDTVNINRSYFANNFVQVGDNSFRYKIYDITQSCK